MKKNNDTALALFSKALDMVNPGGALRRHLQRKDNLLSITIPDGPTQTVDLDGVENVYVVGCGKATALMAEAVEDILGSHLTGGIISVKYGHVPEKGLSTIDLIEAGHPEPDENGVQAASQALELLEKAQEQDLIIALISGGGSALWPLPVEELNLREKITTTRALLECGATIREMNLIRQHLSGIKGGKAAVAAYPARTLLFMISDVENDDPAVIASGPFTRATGGQEDVIKILEKYRLSYRLPERVFQYLLKTGKGSAPRNLKAIFSNISSCICSRNSMAIEAVSKEAAKGGYRVTSLGTSHFGDANDTALHFVETAKKLYQKNPEKKQCVVAGGETTVNLGQSYGKGGRNQEFALAAAMELDKAFRDTPCKVTLLSCGTDGTDGPTDAAGAIVDIETVALAKKAGLNPKNALAAHDAYPFFDQLGLLVKTGPTNTNVMDLQIALIEV